MSEIKVKRTWVGLLNIYLLQFLFIRLFRNVNRQGETTSFGIMGFILPLTGWGSPYLRFWNFSFNLVKVEKVQIRKGV